MEFDLVKILTDVGGPAAVGIALAFLFLRYLERREKQNTEMAEKRDQMWRDFFALINAGNKEDTENLAEAMMKLTQSVTDSFRGIADKLAEHDRRVDDRISATRDIATQQRRTRTTKETK